MDLKFKEYFDIMRDRLKDNFVFRGNLLLVELEGEEEVTETKGGLFIASSKEQVHGLNSGRAKIGYVHLAGSGYIDDDGEVEELAMQPGAIVMCPATSLDYFTVFPGIPSLAANKLALIQETDIKLYWPTVEDYKSTQETLKG